MTGTPRSAGQLRRVDEAQREPVRFWVDGQPAQALAGDTLLTAVLLSGHRLRTSEFGDGARAGFCNMGACQDCWIALEDGTRVRACGEPVRDGMRVLTR
jgi:aerobic-type carbon monoxide dehydrogenase small subunit (CoxS/CutS family)